ncbi:coiled-coil domain-containing protein 157-like, partial [Oryzias melastigma]|uniref:coiled-coil domain-containing protein 157-like n=1 Tax=Oryzias melastigma TaxID=30732 RepID=UPI00168D9558
MLCSRSISSTTELCEPNSQTPDRSRGLSGFSRYVRGVFRSLFKPVNENKLQKDSISADQDEALQQKHQINVLEKENEEMVQELKTLLDKFVCLSDNKDTYISAGDHLKAAQDQNSVLQEKLLQLQLKIQQEEAPLMTTPGVSTEEYKDQIQALEQQKEDLQKEMEELKKKRSQEAEMRIELINLDAQKCNLEGQCQHIQEVIQIHSEQHEVVYPEEIQEMKSLILFLKDEVEILLEEQKEVENSRPGSKGLEKEYH